MKHYNVTITQELNRFLNPKGESVPVDVADFIQPVVLIKAIGNINKGINSEVTGAINVYTTPTDKDFYLTSATFSMCKNAACDQGTGTLSLTGTVEGTTGIKLMGISTITLTAQDQTIHTPFEPPIKIDRGTILQQSASFTAGTMARLICIKGYTLEVTK